MIQPRFVIHGGYDPVPTTEFRLLREVTGRVRLEARRDAGNARDEGWTPLITVEPEGDYTLHNLPEVRAKHLGLRVDKLGLWLVKGTVGNGTWNDLHKFLKDFAEWDATTDSWYALFKSYQRKARSLLGLPQEDPV